MLEHFNTFSDYLNFGWAKEFRIREKENTRFSYSRNRCERIGERIGQIVLISLDFSIRNSRSPLFITAVTIAAISAVTLIFYPAIVAGFVSATLLSAFKLSLYSLSVITIISLCLRTLGRLNNPELMQAWDQGHLRAQPPGTVQI